MPRLLADAVEMRGGLEAAARLETQRGSAVWERRSGGRCLFVMPTNKHYEAIGRKARGSP